VAAVTPDFEQRALDALASVSPLAILRAIALDVMDAVVGWCQSARTSRQRVIAPTGDDEAHER
jgi:hypothetical protein